MRRFQKAWLGRVRVGTMLTALTYRLPPILGRLRTDHPTIDLIVNNMPTQDSVANIIQNKIDLALVALPVENNHVTITPLCEEKLVAIRPRATRDVPHEVTPSYVAQHTLVIEHTRSSAHPLVKHWLGAAAVTASSRMAGSL